MKSADNNQDVRQPRANLHGRYGKIGISAVAAAVRYQSENESDGRVPRRAFSSVFALDDE